MAEAEKHVKLLTPFSIVVIILFMVAILANFYFLYFKKNYDFVVESPCDSTVEQCFERNCSNPEDCPTNELSVFKRYSINAGDFKFCQNEDCTEACESGKITCEPIECTPDIEFGETCSLLKSETEKQNQ